MITRNHFSRLKTFIVAGAVVLCLPLAAYAAEAGSDIAATGRQAAKEVKDSAVGAARQAQQAAEGVVTSSTRQEMDKAAVERLEKKEEAQSVGEYLDDTAITAKVKAGILEEKGLGTLEIKVITVNGEVTLMGDVDSLSQVGLAESVAKRVGGVKSVSNRLVAKM